MSHGSALECSYAATVMLNPPLNKPLPSYGHIARIWLLHRSVYVQINKSQQYLKPREGGSSLVTHGATTSSINGAALRAWCTWARETLRRSQYMGR